MMLKILILQSPVQFVGRSDGVSDNLQPFVSEIFGDRPRGFGAGREDDLGVSRTVEEGCNLRFFVP